MEKLWIDLKSNENNSYEILIGEGVLSRLGRYLNENEASAVITDQNVERLYGKALDHALKGHRVCKIVLPPGEESKTLATVEKILSRMLDFGLRRDSRVIALGGGVVGDIGGFSASIYMRGIPYIQVPTTLLAQVDSSVGGKVAVNHPLGKNMIGAFYPPRLVIIDPAALKTLTKRHFRAGAAEVVKYGIVEDSNFFFQLEKNIDRLLSLDSKFLTAAIAASVRSKARVVEKDEYEQDYRRILNFGHTIGHALESATAYRYYLHGEAVLVGMLLAVKLAQKTSFLDNASAERINRLLTRLKIKKPPAGLTAEKVIVKLEHDKKRRSDDLVFVLPTRIGSAVMAPVNDKKMIAGILETYLGCGD